MNPSKLYQFLNEQLLPDAVKEYAKLITEVEMLAGLKKYIEEKLLPRLGQKAAKGISRGTARQIMLEEGFLYTEHKKALYYDGHECPDVVDSQQDVFIPAFYRHLP